MQAKFYYFSFILSTTIFFGQKKEVFINENLRLVDRASYNEIAKNSFEYIKFKVDKGDVIENRIEKRTVYGKVPMGTYNEIKANLEKASNLPIAKENLIIINFYPGKDDCNAKSNVIYAKSQNTFYLKEIERKSNVSQFYIYSDNEEINRFGSTFTWFPDLNKKIETTFFPYHYPCGSYIFLYPDGTYFLSKGEYTPSQIVAKIRNY